MSIGTRMGGIKEFHCFEIYFTALENKAQSLIKGQLLIHKCGKSLMQKRIDGVIFLAEYPGVIHIRRNTPYTEQEDVFE